MSLNFDDWLSQGIDKKWISEPVCDTHDGIPMRGWEAEEWDAGNDPCVVVVRIWEDGMPDDDEPDAV